jgi:integrase
MRTPREHKARDGSTTWKVRFRIKGQQSSITFPDEPDAIKFCKLLDTVGVERAVAFVNAENPEAVSSGELTLDQWAQRYIKSLTGITPGTRQTYERVYARAWHDALGHLPLRLIDRERIAARVNELSATRADKTVRNQHGLLSAMLSAAVVAGHLDGNPCKGMRLPRRTSHTTTRRRFLTSDEFQALLAEIPTHYRPLVMTLAATGIRWSEAEALTVADACLSGGSPTLRINKSVGWDASASVRQIGPTKTRKSDRTVALPSEAVEAMRPLVSGRPSSARLFSGPEGGPLRHHLFYRSWRRACAKAGLDPCPRIHDLRHSHVAWLVAAGIPLPVIQSRLGHESITTTLDVYGGLLPDLQAAAAAAWSTALGNGKPALHLVG